MVIDEVVVIFFFFVKKFMGFYLVFMVLIVSGYEGIGWLFLFKLIK